MQDLPCIQARYSYNQESLLHVRRCVDVDVGGVAAL